MLRSVLESVSEMLGHALSSETSSKVYTECAKSLLDKTIAGMDEGHITPNIIPIKDRTKAFGEGVSPQPTYEVEAVLGKLVSIKDQLGNELQMNKRIKLNGELTTYGKAKGQAFQNVDLLLEV